MTGWIVFFAVLSFVLLLYAMVVLAGRADERAGRK